MSSNTPVNFDIIGDVHGCLDELIALLKKLGYSIDLEKGVISKAPPNRILVFVGDLVDRGPDSPGVLRLVREAVLQGKALCVCGNHDDKLKRKLQGKDVQITNGLEVTLDQLREASPEFLEQIISFIDQLPYYLVLDQGRLIICHAGIQKKYIGQYSPKIRAFCLYGRSLGTDEKGQPLRYNWAQDYEGEALVVYGHTVVEESVFLNNTLNLDTGCVFGGRLTALRYPERQIVSVPANRLYYPE
ncbi:metallophosphoesterase [Candidatus Odyssella acanthamoebae]|uniref:Protein phosphatase n=1 Tax=Candidatus Odyssella acanthamoebae TaxID=91604 RepID=A0A077AW65_9PROT|nr:metallophosphoesterase [Candidatus Paracaedibacter acanthamoebae]AIK96641.1 protein phosphatase [Candidatus Paracaedibacter acanthamoebae]